MFFTVLAYIFSFALVALSIMFCVVRIIGVIRWNKEHPKNKKPDIVIDNVSSDVSSSAVDNAKK